MFGRAAVTNGDPAILVKPPRPLPSKRVDDRQIWPAVTIDIADGDVEWRVTALERRTCRLLKSAVTIAEKNRYVIAVEIGTDDVRKAIAVEIAYANALVRMLAHCDVSSRRREATLPVAEQELQSVLGPAICHEIKNPVPVEIGRGQAVRMWPDGN
jgi:hypothetical protein